MSASEVIYGDDFTTTVEPIPDEVEVTVGDEALSVDRRGAEETGWVITPAGQVYQVTGWRGLEPVLQTAPVPAHLVGYSADEIAYHMGGLLARLR